MLLASKNSINFPLNSCECSLVMRILSFVVIKSPVVHSILTEELFNIFISDFK